MLTPSNPLIDSINNRWRRYYPLLAILILTLATLACINSELTLTVNHKKDVVDTLDVRYEQYLVPSYVEAAKDANQERAADFTAAGRDPGEPLLPTTREDLKEAFDVKKYKEMGYATQVTETGFTATKNVSLKQDKITEDWKVRIIQNPDHPEQTTYRVKVYFDFSDMDLGDLVKLRNTPLMDKPDPNAADGGSSGSGGFIGDLAAVAGAIAEVAEEQMAVELYYAQKALQNSDPMHRKVTVTLPGTILIHDLDGSKAGTLEGNTVTLLLDEAALAAYSGKEMVFHVESVVTDCSKACDSAPHLIWDGKEGVSCNCICEKGFEVIEGEQACVNCDTICSWSDPNLVTDLIKCEDNKCACWCKEGMVMNRAGTACIDEYDDFVQDLQRSDVGGPSAQALGDLFAAFLDPENDKNINEMPGWFLLTSIERENLLNFLDQLGFAVDRSQLTVDKGPDLTTDQRHQLIIEKQNRLEDVRQAAIDQAETKFEHRQHVQEVIIKQIGGLYYYAQYIPSVLSNYFTTPYDLAVEYVEGKLTDEVTKRIKQEAYGDNPSTITEAAEKLVEEIPKLATRDTVPDYYLYQEIFDKKHKECGSNCSESQAVKIHYEVLVEIRAKIKPQHLEWAKDGAAYDHAFRILNYSVPTLKD